MNDSLNDVLKTVLDKMPKPELLFKTDPREPDPGVIHMAVPANFKLDSIDLEKLLPGPRRTAGHFEFTDPGSFLDYVRYHASTGGPTVWCDFDPMTSKLAFKAVFDEHTPAAAGWRKHTARYEPKMAPEWITWQKHNGKDQAKGQLEFALFLEQYQNDITAAEGYPSSLDMLNMARDFENNAERKLKSRVNLQSGGVELVYVDKDNEASEAKMKVFEKFKIGVPVFWKRREEGKPLQAYAVEARLRYRITPQGAIFWYELLRPELAHERAALEIVAQIQSGLETVPLRFGGAVG